MGYFFTLDQIEDSSLYLSTMLLAKGLLIGEASFNSCLFICHPGVPAVKPFL
jgi:hypothetical protein